MKPRKKIEKHKSQLDMTAKQYESRTDPVLRFTPYSWAKLQWFCHHGDTEIGGFGITSTDDLLLIEEFITVKQSVSCVSVSFDDEAVADFFEAQVDAERKPEQFARIWLHTHPGNSPYPSGMDEETFSRVFGHCQWAVMFVLAKEGKTYARLRFNVGPGGQAVIPVEIDFQQRFSASNHDAWLLEYKANVQPEPRNFPPVDPNQSDHVDWDDSPSLDPTVDQDERELLARTQHMSPDELDDLFNTNEVWL